VLISPEKELWGYKECAASIDRGSVPSTLLIFMSDLIPAKKKAGPQNVARRFVENLTASNVGIAFLSAQITDLERRCAAMRSRINNKRPGRTARRAQPV
jgi:hypothetical protein